MSTPMGETVTRVLQRQILPAGPRLRRHGPLRRPRGGPPRRRPLRDRRQPRGQGPQQRRDPPVDLDRRRDPPRPDRVAHGVPGEVGGAALVRHLLQRVPGQLLAALDDRRRRHPHRRGAGCRRDGHRLQVDGQGPLPAGRRGDRRATTRPTRFSFDLPLKPFIDGGWYWYDVVAGDDDVVVEVGRVDRRGAGRPRRARHGRHRDHHHEPPRLRRQAGRPDRRDRGAAALPRPGDGHGAGHPADARLGVLPGRGEVARRPAPRRSSRATSAAPVATPAASSSRSARAPRPTP